jgi:putative membrane-bound dehydrogenase-like protein
MHIRRVVIAIGLLGSFVLAAEPRLEPGKLPRVPPTEPADAIKTFQLHKGLKVELVASEPLISSPVGISFDEDGRLFVVEMRGYPDQREERLGRIKLLEDSHGDGHYDKATVFADKLPWPTSVICANGGVLVTASPDVLWLKDTRGTGSADERKVVFTGFAAGVDRLNVQALVNGLTWGFDDRIHGATSFNGGSVAAPGRTQPPLALRGRDFAFDPKTLTLAAEDGGGQHGLSFDSHGRKFVCMNSKAVETFLYDSRYAGRNALFPMPPSLIDVTADGPNVFRTSPEEAWRVVRTNWRVAGAVKGPVEGGGRASGYFTGVSGITLYTGDALPPEFRDNAFIGEVANNLVHREVITPDGVSVVAHRAPNESGTEFLASNDIWFRPVQMANGPDGALYVIDMCREVIEHPWSLPDELKQHLDLHSGRERGRIWRVVPEGFVPRKLPRLSKASTAELVALLEHPNGWHRDTAARLLYERNDPAAVPLLRKLLAESKSPVGRLRALCALKGQGELTTADLLVALRDADPAVRVRGVALSEKTPPDTSPELWGALRSLADDPEIAVRYQLAFTLGEFDQSDRVETLSRIARRDFASAPMRAAILSSVGGHEADLFEKMAADPAVATAVAGSDFLQQLARLIGKRADSVQVAGVVRVIDAKSNEPAATFPLARALREGLGGKRQSLASMTALMDKARMMAREPATSGPARVDAIRLLGTGTFSTESPVLLPLLELGQPEELQLAAVSSLDEFGDSQVAAELVKRFRAFPPRVRSAALAALVKRPDRATALLDAVQSGAIDAREIPSAQASVLRRHSDPHVRDLAMKLLAAHASNKDELIRAFQPALELRGDAARGHLVYQQRCISCHKLGAEGFAVGPDLTTIRNDGKAKALVNVLDPNREVAPNYVAYLVESRSGESVVGVVSETATGVTVRQPFGKETTILRSDLKRLESQKLSLMPEGLEQGLKPQDLADLLEFVFTAPTSPH